MLEKIFEFDVSIKVRMESTKGWKSNILQLIRLEKRKLQQRRSWTVEQLQSCNKQEWDKIPLPQVKQLVSLVPRCLWAS